MSFTPKFSESPKPPWAPRRPVAARPVVDWGPPCAACGKATDAKYYCPLCDLEKDQFNNEILNYKTGDLRTFYCNKACQNSHSREYGQNCHLLRKLGRAVNILDEIWRSFEVYTSIGDFHGVSRRDKEVFTRDTPKEKLALWSTTGRSIFQCFYMNEYKRNTIDYTISEAFLYDYSCMEPFTRGLLLVKLILGGLGELKQLNVTIKNPALVIRRDGHREIPPVPFSGANHAVLSIQLEGFKYPFVIDLTGKQFGWKRVLYTWESFHANRVQEMCESSPVDQASHNMNIIMASRDRDDVIRVRSELRGELIQRMTHAGYEFRTEGGITMSTLLGQPEEDYEDLSREIINKIYGGMREMLRDMDNRGLGKMYYRDGHPGHVVWSEDIAAKCRKAWLTEEQLLTHFPLHSWDFQQRWLRAFSRGDAPGE